MKRQYGRHMKKMYRIKSLKCSVLCALVIVLCCACHNAAQIDQELDRKTESSDNSLSTEASENSVSDAGEQNQSEPDVPEETEESVAETPKILRTEVKVKGIYVTTSDFTNDAKSAAKRIGIQMVDGNKLMNMIKSSQK